ncbi:MAG: metalloregulator ArsR/SmtB family transcription factor, partial [Aliifodinibius sp.]|nr:winged helix-turn-helix transcriptional regulator [Fodinibius sp.]NIY25202.1 metalloregulator ArsR/SmtB family transcription factor [Fodinibius sp.]
ICKTLAHPVRLRILNALQIGEKSVIELSSELEVSHGTLSRHLNYMRPWGVVVARRDGQSIYYRIENPKI